MRHYNGLSLQLREFVLSQEEAYEVKIGKQEFRRPGDPPLDDVVEKLKADQSKGDEDGDSDNKNGVTKDELQEAFIILGTEFMYERLKVQLFS